VVILAEVVDIQLDAPVWRLQPSQRDRPLRSDTPTAVVVVVAPLHAGAASTATQSTPATATRPLMLGDIGLRDHFRYPPMAVCFGCDHAMALPGAVGA
jgi:hypothetical protein